MATGERDLTLRDLIHKAFHTQYEGNPFFYDQREKEEEQLLKGIGDKNSKAEKGSEGTINLNQTLHDLLDDRDAFLKDIDDFIAGRYNGKYQYAVRFKALLDYLNNYHGAELQTDFLKKHLFKDDDRRTLDLLKRMHAETSRSAKSMAKIADEYGVDVKTIRRDFNRLETSFCFLDAEIKIHGFNADYNSPVHPVFLALNSSQLYGLFYALKILSAGTVLEEFSQELSHSIYSQMTVFARGLVSDIYRSDEFPEDFQNRHIDSAYILRQQNQQVVFHAAAYKRSCTIKFEYEGEERMVTGIPKIIRDAGHNLYTIEMDSGESLEISADSIIQAFERT